MPTRDDVAKLAGVSSATVSRCYNNPNSVSAKKLEIVLKAAAKLKYSPDKNASSLRRSSSGVIAFVEEKIKGLSADRNYSWLYAELICALKNVIDSSPYILQLITIDSPGQLTSLVKNKTCDAIILHDIHNREIIKVAITCGLPVVACWREQNQKINTVSLDEYFGGKMIAEHLLSNNLNKPSHITAMLKTHPACIERFKGFKSVFTNTSIKVIDGKFGIQGGYASAKKLIPHIKNKKIDSIFVVNDMTAIGVIQALSEASVSIPNDVSVVSYGNNPIIDTLPFKLTTVDEQMGEIYSQAARMALDLLKNNLGLRHEWVKPVFVAGQTVRRNYAR